MGVELFESEFIEILPVNSLILQCIFLRICLQEFSFNFLHCIKFPLSFIHQVKSKRADQLITNFKFTEMIDVLR